jgi:hypothetical protein
MGRTRQASKCTAHCSDGRSCKNFAVTGAVVCAAHGGRAPQVKAAAARRALAAKAHAAATTLGLDVEDADPAALLLEEVSRAAGICRWLQQRVGELDPAVLTWSIAGRTAGKQAQGSVDFAEKRAQIHPLVQLYAQERGHLLRACQVTLAAGVAARQIELAEELGGHIADCMAAVLDDLGLSPDQREAGRLAVPRQLARLISDLHAEGIG